MVLTEANRTLEAGGGPLKQVREMEVLPEKENSPSRAGTRTESSESGLETTARTGQLLTAKTGRELREEAARAIFGEVSDCGFAAQPAGALEFVPKAATSSARGPVMAKNPFEPVGKAVVRSDLLARLAKAKAKVADCKDTLRSRYADRWEKFMDGKDDLENEFLAKYEVLEERAVELEEEYSEKIQAHQLEQIKLEKRLAEHVKKGKALQAELACKLEENEAERGRLFDQLDRPRAELEAEAKALDEIHTRVISVSPDDDCDGDTYQ
jgi:hypothetical protein